ncbi:MAG: hypothetical protein GY950_21840 [bacterium]|nr:hypothetical protein [bacterium]
MSENLEAAYKEIFGSLKTRFAKKFKFLGIEGNTAKIEREDDVCGQMEKAITSFNTPEEMKTFIDDLNREEAEYQKKLESNQMPYR